MVSSQQITNHKSQITNHKSQTRSVFSLVFSRFAFIGVLGFVSLAPLSAEKLDNGHVFDSNHVSSSGMYSVVIADASTTSPQNQNDLSDLNNLQQKWARNFYKWLENKNGYITDIQREELVAQMLVLRDEAHQAILSDSGVHDLLLKVLGREEDVKKYALTVPINIWKTLYTNLAKQLDILYATQQKYGAKRVFFSSLDYITFHSFIQSFFSRGKLIELAQRKDLVKSVLEVSEAFKDGSLFSGLKTYQSLEQIVLDAKKEQVGKFFAQVCFTNVGGAIFDEICDLGR
ncbi:hypothetical protein [Helicobacter suis]|uniref:hypothetical protein n=1 Tax=Helicobacter suis TaxID=104628 RepID=UPI0013D3B61E|nr:hypothetical protein [Helicobacter suis]